MLGQVGQYALEVLADGVDLKLDPSDLGHFNIINNILEHLPSASFMFKDKTGKFIDQLIKDGSKLEISIGLPDDLYSALQFVSSGIPDVDGADISVRGFLDKMPFMRSVIDKHHEGNSSDVISALAKAVGLEADVDTTDDSMIWLPNRTTIAQYARHVTDRAFSTAGSALIMAVTDSGKLRYKDLDTLISKGPGKTLASDSSKGDFQILDWTVASKAHVTNNNQGYGSTTIGMNEDGSIFEGNKVAMKLFSAATSISESLSGAIGDLGGRINVLAPLAGNTHKNWYKALHENERVKQSYAFDLNVVVDRPSRLELLDVVRAIPNNPQTGQEARDMVGNYIVTATTKFITNNRFMEKLVLTAQGPGGV